MFNAFTCCSIVNDQSVVDFLTKEPPFGGILDPAKTRAKMTAFLLGLKYSYIDLAIILEPKRKSSTKKALIPKGFLMVLT